MTTEQKGRACSQQVTGPNNTTTTVDTAEHNPLPPLPLPLSSRQVNWFDCVYLFVKPWLDAVGSWPMVGTPAWCDLPDDHPAKWAALLDAAQHWALRVETCQAAECEASRAVSAAADWGAVGTEMVQLNSFYEFRPWLKRRAS